MPRALCSSQAGPTNTQQSEFPPTFVLQRSWRIQSLGLQLSNQACPVLTSLEARRAGSHPKPQSAATEKDHHPLYAAIPYRGNSGGTQRGPQDPFLGWAPLPRWPKQIQIPSGIGVRWVIWWQRGQGVHSQRVPVTAHHHRCKPGKCGKGEQPCIVYRVGCQPTDKCDTQCFWCWGHCPGLLAWVSNHNQNHSHT